MTHPFDLTGSTALVTGASRGIGAGIALALAAAGADIIGTSRSSSLDATADAVRELGREFTPLAADLTTTAGVHELVAKVDDLAPVEILVNNAGLANRNPAEVHTDQQWDEVISVNLSAPFTLARELGSRMLERESGRIIFLASMNSFQGGRNVVSYTASKSGVTGIVHALANEWADRGVTVNAIAPGYIETDLTSGSHGDAARRRAFQERIPVGRWGTPADLGGAAVFLASPAAAYVNGAVLPVDGGWLVR
jgi:2-deoxy-D-gluconate 3-dehydrogenase